MIAYIVKRDLPAVEWLLKQRNVTFYQDWDKMGFDDPTTRLMMKGGPQIPKFLTNRRLWESGSELFCVEGDINEFINAPEKIKKIGARLFSSNHKSDKPKNPTEISQGTNIAKLEDELVESAESYIDKISQRTTKRGESLRSNGQFFHVGPPGYKPGHIIKPYFEVQTGLMIGDSSASLEEIFENLRPQGAVPRLNSAYAFKDPKDAIMYAYGGKRQLYSVEVLGKTTVCDMRCVETVEDMLGIIKDNYKEAEYEDDEDDESMWQEIDKEADNYDEDIADVVRAYWSGQPCPKIGGRTEHNHHMTTAPEPVWEVICSGGLRVVADHGNMSESLVRSFVRNVLREILY